MKQPAWKRLLSYVHEFHIESTTSEHNPHMYVSLVRGRYQLCTANAIYSHGDLYDNFSGAFEKINLDALPIQKVLVLGFGLGSIPIILEKLFNKKYQYTAVEIDEEVLYLANKYAIPEISSPVQFVCADAFLFVNQCNEKFDMITVDIFLDDLVPWQFEQDDFLQQLKNLLTPKGILLYNRLAYTKKDIENAEAFYQEKFKRNFPDGAYIEVKGNWMLVNDKEVLKERG